MADVSKPLHPKTLRRKLLELLYARYLNDPLEMLSPEDFLEHVEISRRELMVNMHYLGDRKLVELMMSFNPPMFAAARITANGIDLVENRFEFNQRFPAEPGAAEDAGAEMQRLIEELLEQAELSPLEGEARGALLQDVNYLRDELARPAPRWRRDVLESVLGWIERAVGEPETTLPALGRLRARLGELPGE